jgi:O-antigen/teichoic acid export membrane protein
MFGTYAGATATFYLACAITDLGFGVVAAREMATHPDEQREVLYATVEVQFIWSAIVAFGLLALGVSTGNTRGEAMVVLAPAVLVGGLGSARQLFTVRYSAGPLLIVDLATVVVQSAALCGLAVLHAGVVPIAAALSVITSVNVVIVAVLARRMIGPPGPVHWGRLRLLRMAVPLGVASVVASLYFTIDQVLLGWLVRPRELGEYAAAVRLLSTLVVVPGFVMAAGIPALARTGSDRTALSRTTGMLAHWLAVTVVPAAVALIVFADPVIHLLYGPGYAQAADLLRVLMVAALCCFIAIVLGNVLLVLSIVRVMIVFNLVSLVVNVAGNLLLVPRYGVAASAWLTVVSELIVISYAVFLLRRRLHYTIVLSRLWKPIAAAACGGAVGIALGPNHPYAMVAAGIAFTLALFGLGAWPSELVPWPARSG